MRAALPYARRGRGWRQRDVAGPAESTAPRAGRRLVLTALILVAAVANLNLAVANVALPSIGAAFDSSQTTLDLIAVGYSLGLAASVLYFGAVGDRYGRKLMLILGTALAIPVVAARGLRAVGRRALRRARARRALRRAWPTRRRSR